MTLCTFLRVTEKGLVCSWIYRPKLSDLCPAPPESPSAGVAGRVAATFRACPERIEGLRNFKGFLINPSGGIERPPGQKATANYTYKF